MSRSTLANSPLEALFLNVSSYYGVLLNQMFRKYDLMKVTLTQPYALLQCRAKSLSCCELAFGRITSELAIYQ